MMQGPVVDDDDRTASPNSFGATICRTSKGILCGTEKKEQLQKQKQKTK